MYEEKSIEFDWKGFLIKLALLIIVIILIIKLLPLNNKNSNQYSAEFKNNMATLRTKSNDYFDSDKLPTRINESIKVSLDDLIKVGAVRTLNDIDGNSCNVQDSYVKATKQTNDYELEIHLICGKEKETTYVYLNQNKDKVTTSTTADINNNEQTTTSRKINSNSGNNNNNSNTNNTQNDQVGYVTSKVKKTTVPANNVSLIFNSNGGTKVSMQYIKIGSTAIRPSNPTRTGYTFLGWFYNNKEYNFNSAVNTNIILLAKWTSNSTLKPITTTKTTTTTTKKVTNTVTTQTRYVVSFDSNGGTKKSSKTINSGSYVSKPSDPVRKNAEFIGWYYNNKLFNFNTRIYKNITLVAKYNVTETATTEVYSAGWGNSQVNSFTVNHTLAIPKSLSHSDYKDVRIKSLSFIRSLSSDTDMHNLENLHKSTFEYNYNNGDYTSGTVNNLATIYSASVVKSSYNIYNRGVTWTGNISRQCSTKFNYLDITNACLFGIIYRVTWEYEIVK